MIILDNSHGTKQQQQQQQIKQRNCEVIAGSVVWCLHLSFA